MKHKIALLWSWFVRTVTFFLPDTPLSMRFRGCLYGMATKRCGKDFQVGSGAKLIGLENLSVGNHVYLAPNSVILSSFEVIIEDEVMVSYNTVVVDSNHTILDGSYRFGYGRRASVRIGNGSWVGANCTIVAGVIIGEGVLIAANSAVINGIPSGVIAGGVPAKLIKAGDIHEN
jgi:acetyltransferase-like isoleucine patch superfamily enzyme